MEAITQGNLDALRQGYDQLKEHPCPDCSNELRSCDVCHEARQWLNETCPLIFSPLLKQVIEEFMENHCLSQTIIEEGAL